MEPTSSPDHDRHQRGLARFWPGHRDGADDQPTPDSPDTPVARPGDTEMVALGSRREISEADDSTGAPGSGASEPGEPDAPTSGAPGPGSPAPARRDPDHSGAADPGDDHGQAVQSSGAHPWQREPSAIGGFGLGGRDGRLLFGGHSPVEPRPGRNGHATGLNGRASKPSPAASTVDGPQPPPGAADRMDHSDENGRDDMNGRAFPTAGDVAPAGNGNAPEAPPTAGRRLGDAGDLVSGAGRRRTDHTEPADAAEAAEATAETHRRTTGWASLPTTTNPLVPPASPASGIPAPSAPVSGPPPVAPISPARGPGGGFGQPPAYVPGLPDPTSGPVSGVPTPRTAASASVPVPAAPTPAPVSPAAHPAAAEFPATARPANTEFPATTRPANTEFPAAMRPAGAEFPAAEAPATEAATPQQKAVPGPGAVAITFGEPTVPAFGEPPAAFGEPPSAFGDLPSPRRSASLEDAEPVRRGRRAAPDDDEEPGEDSPLRPGDVAAGHITFWDDDATRHFRAAWHEVKAEFVDDPVTALTRAHDLLTDAVNELTEAMLAERDELDPLRGTATPDTESMRMAMRGYREFLDRILAL